ncbi:MAG TPA: hypothetical protein VHB20_15425 [Verrucomicrobiae bacterium]|nr:hypothetical protein [Verrucomicrobiae bacterium]
MAQRHQTGKIGTKWLRSIDKMRFRLWLGVWFAVLVHLLFVVQLLMALPDHGLILQAFAAVFMPHAILMYFLPPRFDFLKEGIDWWRLVGKMIDAAPASLFYGFLLQQITDRALKVWRKRRAP